jgi:hypothetical protein
MKILGNFDQAITEALQKNVKARLQFKVRRQSRCPAPVPPRLTTLAYTGKPRYIQILRRSLDFLDQERDL